MRCVGPRLPPRFGSGLAARIGQRRLERRSVTLARRAHWLPGGAGMPGREAEGVTRGRAGTVRYRPWWRR